MSEAPTTKDLNEDAVTEPDTSDTGDEGSKIGGIKGAAYDAAMSTESVPSEKAISDATGMPRPLAKVVRGVMKAAAHVTKHDMDKLLDSDGETAAIVDVVSGAYQHAKAKGNMPDMDGDE